MMIRTYYQGGIPVSSGKGAQKYATLVVENPNGSFAGELEILLAAESILKGDEPKRMFYDLCEEYDIDGHDVKIIPGKLIPRKIDKEIMDLVNSYNKKF
jgi:hypothetical protein